MKSFGQQMSRYDLARWSSDIKLHEMYVGWRDDYIVRLESGKIPPELTNHIRKRIAQYADSIKAIEARWPNVKW